MDEEDNVPSEPQEELVEITPDPANEEPESQQDAAAPDEAVAEAVQPPSSTEEQQDAATPETAPKPSSIEPSAALSLAQLKAEEAAYMERQIQSLQLTKRYGLRNADANSMKLVHCFGFQSHKRSNIHFVEEHVIVSSMGNLIIFLNLKTGDARYVKGIREGSIGCIAVHPTKEFIAVGEICEQEPNIYVYTYPSMTLSKILRGGAVKGFADLSFNQTGTKIASVAMDPDYMLTIWNWTDSMILLRSKAFSQDVYRVSFSPDNDGILTTSGMGHIKFWRMSSTFTGLKLQGYIGKFGASELSDIAAFIQLPDGKVLSSTETGNFLLWDGGMIKCEIGVKGKKPCHQGRIEVILLGEGEVITAGEDGFVRIWDLETIDNADVVSTTGGSEGSSAAVPRVFEMEPIDEVLIAKDVKIKCLIRNFANSMEYIVQDQQGQLIKLDFNKRTTEKIHSFHSGA
ncbi:Cilia- and flagella-associated protein 44, partial [Kappamyces sp. JEL0680]